jgi:hypothetical protein
VGWCGGVWGGGTLNDKITKACGTSSLGVGVTTYSEQGLSIV